MSNAKITRIVQDASSLQEYLYRVPFANTFNAKYRGKSCWSWIAVPLTDGAVIPWAGFLFYIDSNYNIVMSSIVEQTGGALLPQEIFCLDFQRLVRQAKAGHCDIFSYEDEDYTFYTSTNVNETADLFQLTDDYLELFWDNIKSEFLTALNNYAGARSIDKDIDDAVYNMQISGATAILPTLAGRAYQGYVVEIYKDVYKYRARTNDGTHGVANCTFPTNARQPDSVYIIPPEFVSYSGGCYRIGLRDVSKYKVR